MLDNLGRTDVTVRDGLAGPHLEMVPHPGTLPPGVFLPWFFALVPLIKSARPALASPRDFSCGWCP